MEILLGLGAIAVCLYLIHWQSEADARRAAEIKRRAVPGQVVERYDILKVAEQGEVTHGRGANTAV